MKRLFICIVLIILMAGIISDLRSGTLPSQTQGQTQVQAQKKNPPSPNNVTADQEKMKAQEVIIEPGHTVLSIVEHLHQGPVSVSIEQIIDDFKSLNNSLEPDAIQIGKTYLFPIYDKE